METVSREHPLDSSFFTWMLGADLEDLPSVFSHQGVQPRGPGTQKQSECYAYRALPLLGHVAQRLVVTSPSCPIAIILQIFMYKSVASFVRFISRYLIFGYVIANRMILLISSSSGCFHTGRLLIVMHLFCDLLLY